MSFLPGKVPTEILEKIVFRNLGAKRDDVVLSPSVGEDAAIVQAGNTVLAVSSDPPDRRTSKAKPPVQHISIDRATSHALDFPVPARERSRCSVPTAGEAQPGSAGGPAGCYHRTGQERDFTDSLENK